jgi:hypothetical protein
MKKGCLITVGVLVLLGVVVVGGAWALLKHEGGEWRFLGVRLPVPEAKPVVKEDTQPASGNAGATPSAESAAAPEATASATPADAAAGALAKPAVSPHEMIPEGPDLKKLIVGTLLDFNAAVRNKNFAEFHAHGSAALQQADSPEKLQKSFSSFIDRRIDIGGVKSIEPVFQPAPAVDAGGVLRLVGYFPGNPPLKFKLSYVRQGDEWKLYHIGLKTD